MAIKSEVYKGLIHAGDTPLALTCGFEQTGPAQISISEGIYTATNGEICPIAAQSFDLADGNWRLELGKQDGGDPSVCVVPVSMFPPAGWELMQLLAGYFMNIYVSGGVISGDVYVLKVLPGFPS